MTQTEDAAERGPAARRADPGVDGDRAGARAHTGFVAACAAALFAALAWPALSGKVYGGNDLEHFHLPLRWFYASALAAGQAFDWIPTLFAGFYLTGEGQAGTWHPLHLALYRVLPLGAAFDAEVLASYVVLFAGVVVFLRRPCFADDGDDDPSCGAAGSGLPLHAALLGAMLFTFSASTMQHFVHPNAIAVVAHLPWNLAAIDVAARSGPRGRRLAALAFLAASTCSTLLCGYPQYVWITGCAEAAWMVVALGSADGAPPLRRATALLAAKALGAAMAAVQLLPTWEHLQGARRYVLDQDLSAAGSLHPLNLVQLVAPYLLRNRALGDHAHEYGVYAGAVPLLLVAWLFASRRERPWLRAHAGLALLGAGALLLALGRYAGTHALQAALPVVGTFRFPARFLFLFHFSTSMLAAVGFARLAARTATGNTPAGDHPGWFVAVVSLLLTVVLRTGLDPALAGSAAGAVAGPLRLGAAAAALALALRGARGATAVLVALAALDAGAYGLPLFAWPFARPLDAIVDSVPPPPAPGVRIATLQPGLLGRYTGNLPLVRGVEMFDGYAGLPQAVQPASPSIEHLRLAGVEHVLRTAPGIPLAGLSVRDDAWLDVPSPLPRVRLATRAVVADDAAAALRERPGDDAHETVFVASPIDLDGPAGSIDDVRREPGRLRARIAAPSAQMLVVAERFHAGWRATVDGQPAAVHDVNGGFLGVEAGPGNVTVELVFAPDGLRVGRAVSLAACVAWGLLSLAALVAGRADRRGRAGGEGAA